MKKKKISGFYLLVLVLFVGMLYVNRQYFRGSSSSNVGITYAREYKISSEKSGSIKEVYVVPGQEVKAGQLLVEMENNGLEIQLDKLKNEIAALKKEKEERATLVESKIAYLKAEGGIKDKTLESEIAQIHSEVGLNRRLTEEFIGKPDNNEQDAPLQGPQDIKIGSLQEMKKLNTQALNIKIEDLRKDHASEMLILTNNIELKERELQLMMAEQARMNKFATSDGIVEGVYVRKGEEVQAYIPLISLNPKSPNSVIGYMIGPRSRELTVGEKVTVSPLNNMSHSVEGEVIGSGAINELPEILQKSTAVKAFGREIFIKIPTDNFFATGEKVLIR